VVWRKEKKSQGGGFYGSRRANTQKKKKKKNLLGAPDKKGKGEKKKSRHKGKWGFAPFTAKVLPLGEKEGTMNSPGGQGKGKTFGKKGDSGPTRGICREGAKVSEEIAAGKRRLRFGGD